MIIVNVVLLLIATSVALGCNSTTHFQCNNGQCIAISWRCDKQHDCHDWSDEADCDLIGCNSKTEFQCDDGRQCIPLTWRCDGGSDCKDKSDEADCDATACNPKTHFQCKDGQCIHLTWKCDGDNDCIDSSDEADCAEKTKLCKSSEYQCSNGNCISKQWLCDRDIDCQDGSDENNCTTTTTTATACVAETEFQCESDKTCIHQNWRCDGEADCDDKSDEMNCNATTTTQSTVSPAAVEPENTTVIPKCSESEFQCASDPSFCIHVLWRCDNDHDCPDRSDEADCNITTITASTASTAAPGTEPTTMSTDSCGEFEFQCESDAASACIQWTRTCDGYPDCSDQSDEKNCNTTATAATSTTGTISAAPTTGTSSKDNTAVTDAASTVTMTTVPCEKDQFHCGSATGDTCIPRSQRCDGSPDCPNGSDEKDCRHYCTSQADQTGCPDEELRLLVTHEEGILSLHPASSTHTVLVARSAASDMSGIDFHYRNHFVYFTDTYHNSILRLDLANNMTTVISENIVSPRRLAVDWVHDHLYWVDEDAKVIRVASLDGGLQKILIKNLGWPRSVAVHPGKRLLFWSDWSNSNIERCGLNGEHRHVVTDKNVGGPDDLAIDYEEERLYWTDVTWWYTRRICSSDFDGKNRQVIMNRDGLGSLSHPDAVAVFKEFVYWVDQDSVRRFNKSSVKGPVPLDAVLLWPKDLCVFHPRRQLPYNNACGSDNGGCDELCLPDVSGTFTCACREGFCVSPSDPTKCISENSQVSMATTPASLNTITSQEVSITPTSPDPASPTQAIVSSSSTIPDSIQKVSSSSTVPDSIQKASSSYTVPDSIQKVSTSSTESDFIQEVSTSSTLPDSIQKVSTSSTLPDSTQRVSTSSTLPDSTQKVSTSSTLPDSTQKVSTFSTLPDSSQKVSTSSTLPDSTQKVSTSSTVPDSNQKVSPSSTVPDSIQEVNSSSTVPDSTQKVSPSSTVPDSIQEVSTSSTVRDSTQKVSSSSTVPDSIQEVSTSSTVRDSTQKVSSSSTLPDSIQKVSTSSTLPDSTQKVSSSSTVPDSIQKVSTSSTVPDSIQAVSTSSVTPKPVSVKKKGSMFYMLLMGFRAESEDKAVNMLQMLKDAARDAIDENVAIVELPRSKKIF